VKKIRYAVVGLGNISQSALLPGFRNVRNSELTALVTSDPKKAKEIAKRYSVDADSTYSYDEYDQCLRSGKIDAVYIGLPNHLHCEYTVRAARAGVHVLCEKPMAVNEGECRKMIEACQKAGVKLMIAYRLHFDQANLEAVKIARSRKLGDLRIFTSVFSQQVMRGNIRLEEPESRGGGSVFDMGVYCVNAARYLFREEPAEVIASAASNGDSRFRKTKEMTTAILKFRDNRLADFTSSFGAADVSEYLLVGTKGSLRMSPAYDYSIPLEYELKVGDGKPQRKRFPKHDQFGAELEYFSNCILRNRKPEPSGEEGLADVRVVEAILKSAASGKPVRLGRFTRRSYPEPAQKVTKRAVKPPRSIDAAPPSGN
jgi:predicted dehydrogenase